MEINQGKGQSISLQEDSNPARVTSEKTRLKKHLDDVNEEYDEEKVDLEDKMSSVRSEITSTKRNSWKEKEAQDLEIQKLENLTEEERKKFQKEFTKQRDFLIRKSSGTSTSDTSTRTNKTTE